MDPSADPADGVGVLRVAGEVDLATAPGFRAEAEALLVADGLRTLVLDLRDVEFLDSSGIEMLSSIRTECLESSVELVLRGPRPRIVDLLRMTGTLAGFAIED